MSARSVATRYARALLDVAVKSNQQEQADRDLGALVQVLDQHQDLQRVLFNPAVPAKGKQGVVRELAQRLGASPAVAKLLTLLAERDRLGLLRDLADVYHERLLEHQQVVRAEVTTAVPLAVEHAEQVRRRLAEVTGRQVTMTTRVDPGIIGGVVTKIGSTVYDGSVARQLAALKEKLVAGA